MNQIMPYTEKAASQHPTMVASPSQVILQSMKNASSAKNSGSMCMPDDNAFDPHKAIRDAFEMAIQGRKSATLAASRLESILFRDATTQGPLAAAAVEYLSGAELTQRAANAQSVGQIVLARLNHAMDGTASRVTKAVLDPDAVARLRVFRQQVRELIKTETAQAAGDR